MSETRPIAVMSVAEARRLVDDLRASGRTIVFTNGVFDLLHPGHVHSMEFDGGEYPKGIYFLVVRSSKAVLVTKRLMVDR